MENEKVNSINGKTFEEFTMNAFKILVAAIKSANKLPFGRNRDLYESCPTFYNILNRQQSDIISNLANLIKHTGCKGNIKNMDDEDRFELIVDVNDSILERTSISLDEISGVNKDSNAGLITPKTDVSYGDWKKFVNVTSGKAAQVLNFVLSQTKNMEKSQLKFVDKINNDSNVPFEPRIKNKYNLLKPLALTIEKTENGVCQYSHPYEFELEKFTPLETQLLYQEPKLYKNLEQTPFYFVAEKSDLKRMIDDLQKYTEISVDLEHHSYRSFQGFTCLMQISTRDTDYIVDTLILRSELEDLNKVFTDPKIVKVFHGSDSDILWLQRDLSLYVVNMFDTHQAAKVLNYPNLSLAYLLQKFCNVFADKHYQLADWRIRPIPDELLKYAREDTHYLLFIYDNLKNALLEKCNGQTNLLESVIRQSTRICLKTYVKPSNDLDGYLDIYHRSKKLFDNRQKFALQRLFEWRDATARNLDESLAYVLPNHMMLNISEILPREAQGILACCNPVPLPVRQNLLNLHQIILKAREEPLVKPILEEQRLHRYHTTVNSTDNPLYCPHDLIHEEDFRDDLPVLLATSDKEQTGPESTSFASSIPIVNIFEKNKETSFVVENSAGSSPYNRYKLAKKFSEFVEAEKSSSNDRNRRDQKLKEISNSAESISVTGEEDKNKTLLQSTPVSDLDNTIDVEVNGEKDLKRSNKRSVKEDTQRFAKKMKTKNSEVLVEDHGLISNSGKRGGFKKGKITRNQQEKHFMPYNYESANFDQYKTSKPAVLKRNERKKVMSKCKKGKRNIKISI